jgi:HJR/Mrr/RecB family endonuclease
MTLHEPSQGKSICSECHCEKPIIYYDYEKDNKYYTKRIYGKELNICEQCFKKGWIEEKLKADGKPTSKKTSNLIPSTRIGLKIAGLFSIIFSLGVYLLNATIIEKLIVLLFISGISGFVAFLIAFRNIDPLKNYRNGAIKAWEEIIRKHQSVISIIEMENLKDIAQKASVVSNEKRKFEEKKETPNSDRKIHRNFKRKKAEPQPMMMRKVDTMEGQEFELFLFRLFKDLGYTAELTSTTGDQGVDLIISRGMNKVAVQAKRYQGNVSNSAVQEVHAGKTVYSCDEAWVVTNSNFTSSAKSLAKSLNVKLINREELEKFIAARNRKFKF